MEFDLSTIFPLVLGIIYFIISGRNKNKKKAEGRSQNTGRPDNPETVGPPPLNRRPSFEELLAEFTGEKVSEPEPQLETVPVKKEVVAPPPPQEVMNKYQTASLYLKKEEKTTSLLAFDNYGNDAEEDRENYADMFSDLEGAKRAFIASEIFQRKY